jgi:large subunit ribosomal protein L9
MEIILLKDVPNLGHVDDRMKVKNGYASNYLIPQGMATAATRANVKIWEAQKEQCEKSAQKRKKDAEALATKIKGMEIALQVKTNKDNMIFGTITPLQLVEVFKQEGISLAPKQITLPTPVKMVGDHAAHIVLHPKVTAEITFAIQKKV